RKDPSMHPKAVMARWQKEFSEIRDGIVFGILPPPILGLSTTGGAEFVLQDRGNSGTETFVQVANKLMDDARKRPEVAQVISTFASNVPHIWFDLDRAKCRTLSVPVSDAYAVLESYLGQIYINDFTLYGKSYKVMMQGDIEFRDQKDDILRLQVRNS